MQTAVQPALQQVQQALQQSLQQSLQQATFLRRVLWHQQGLRTLLGIVSIYVRLRRFMRVRIIDRRVYVQALQSA